MSTNGGKNFDDPVEQRRSNPSSGPNFFPEQWNGVGDQQTGQQPRPSADEQLRASAYDRNVPPADYRRQQQGDIPPEFQQPSWSTRDGQGNTYNFYIREAHINMGDRTGFDFRSNPTYDYRAYDPQYQQMNRRINYYDQQQQMYEQQARMQYIREQQYMRAMEQRQYMYDQWQARRGGYDYGYYPQQPTQVYQDGVHGGPDGYSASRTRVNTGGYNDGGYVGTPPFVPGGNNGMDADRWIDLGFGVLDRVFANEANRRAYRNNNDRYDRPQPHYPRPRQPAPPYYGDENCPWNNRGNNRRPQFPPGYQDVIRRRGY